MNTDYKKIGLPLLFRVWNQAGPVAQCTALAFADPRAPWRRPLGR